MYKIAILGCENSHAKNFLELIAKGRYPEIRVIGIYSDEPEAVQKLHDAYGVPVMSAYDELVGQLDGLMITARHGDNHYKYAKPYLNDGIPMFIDKPITCAEAEAIAFMQEAEQKGVRLCGGSTCAALTETLSLAEAVKTNALGELRGGSLACPLYGDSPYGGFYFYAQHLIEVMTTIFGAGVQRIFATRQGDNLTFIAQYAQYQVTGTYVEKSHYYAVSVYGSKESAAEKLTFTPESFCHEMDDMLALLQGEPMQKSYAQFIHPVFLMNTILRSLASGQWESVPEILL